MKCFRPCPCLRSLSLDVIRAGVSDGTAGVASIYFLGAFSWHSLFRLIRGPNLMRWRTSGALWLLAGFIGCFGSVALPLHAQPALPQGAAPSLPAAAASPP